MSTIRVAKKRENPYIMIDKFAIDQDARISWAAKGMLTYLIGKPDDWIIRITDLIKRASNGRDAVYTIIRELKDAGYIEQEQIRGESSGQFGDISYIVHETPLHTNPIGKADKRKRENRITSVSDPLTDIPDTVKNVDKSPLTDIPDTDKPNTGKPDTENTEHSNNDFSNNDFSNNDFSNKEEEEDSLYTPPAFAVRFIEKDIEKITKEYNEYAKVIEDIGAEAIKNRRPVFGEEEQFLAAAKAIPVHPETLWNIYTMVKPELNRSIGKDYATELIETVFERFSKKLHRGQITFDAARWFHTTWANESIQIEQANMIRK